MAKLFRKVCKKFSAIGSKKDSIDLPEIGIVEIPWNDNDLLIVKIRNMTIEQRDSVVRAFRDKPTFVVCDMNDYSFSILKGINKEVKDG